MLEHIPYFKVFISSPGDVTDERKIALEVIERLPNRPAFRDRVAFRIVAWDKVGAGIPMRATLTPQETINDGLPKPSECDLVIVLFWSRMGTPFIHTDGKEYMSGTHWELLDALTSKRPQTVLYRRTEEKLFKATDTEGQAQYLKVDAFLKSDLFYKEGRILRGINMYATPEDFRQKFETDFEALVIKLLDESKTTLPKPDDSTKGILLESKPWPAGKSPFPGLRAFTEADEEIFFGRGREIDQLKARVADHRFTAVVGASGSGKSSLVGAGLIPRLRANAIIGSQDWCIARFTPGMNGNPFAALYDALRQLFPIDGRQEFIQKAIDDPANVFETIEGAFKTLNAPEWAELLLFIDQFEELFTLAKQEYRAPFTRLLTAIANFSRIRVVTTMRADFYPRAVEHHDLAELLKTGSFPLAAPLPGSLYQMITRPAERASLNFERDLPERILDDTGIDAGSLALMAYALDELYKIAVKRGDNKLTFTDYEMLGGVPGAIGKRAEEAFAALAETAIDKNTLLAHVFRELVEVDDRGTATRRRVPIERFQKDELTLVKAFTNARLLVMDAEYIEVAHEALFRSWERLQTWIAEDQEDLILLRQVRTAAHEWQMKSRPDYLRWPQERLKLIYAMHERLEPELNDIEQAFVESEQTRLLRELENIETMHYRRLAIGERLNFIGDTRPGVGTRLIGAVEIPDIDWRYVAPGGSIEIKGKTFEVQPFYIARYQVTYLQFETFVKAPDGFNDDRWWDGMPDHYKKQKLDEQDIKSLNNPRDNVSWYQAVAFSRWLDFQYRQHGLLETVETPKIASGTDGRDESRPYGIRLPTEWEWQWAAQNGTPSRKYPWGDEWHDGVVNTRKAGLNRPIAVGMYPHGAAACGALDMMGNLGELCLNNNNLEVFYCYIKKEGKVLRGGSFGDEQNDVTCVSRQDTRDPYLGSIHIGFRLCFSLSAGGVEEASPTDSPREEKNYGKLFRKRQ